MHYYSILYWPSGDTTEPSWMILDSLDRGDESPRNRLLKTEEVIGLHDQSLGKSMAWDPIFWENPMGPMELSWLMLESSSHLC